MRLLSVTLLFENAVSQACGMYPVAMIMLYRVFTPNCRKHFHGSTGMSSLPTVFPHFTPYTSLFLYLYLSLSLSLSLHLSPSLSLPTSPPLYPALSLPSLPSSLPSLSLPLPPLSHPPFLPPLALSLPLSLSATLSPLPSLSILSLSYALEVRQVPGLHSSSLHHGPAEIMHISLSDVLIFHQDLS